MRQANCAKVSGRPAGMVRSASQTLALEGRAADIESNIESGARRKRKTQDLGYIFLYGALVADEHIVRKDLPKLDFQFFRVRTQQDGAHTRSTACNEDLADIAAKRPRIGWPRLR